MKNTMANRYGAIDFADRRSFLRAMGFGMAAAPFIPLLEAQAATAPPRLAIMVGSNGVGALNQFFPTGNATNFTLGATTKSLETLKKDLICFGNEFDGRIMGGSIPHPEAAANLLTATAPTSPGREVDVDARNKGTRATGPSVDQVIAKHIGKGTAFESLALGCGSQSGNDLGGSIVYRGARDPIIAELEVYTTFDRLFPGAGSVSVPGVDVRKGDASTLLEAVSKSLNAMKLRVGAEDAHRIEGHLDSVVALKARAVTLENANTVQATGGCAAPTMPPRGNTDVFKSRMPARYLKEIMQVNVDMAVAAMACDLTRVVVFQVGATTALWPPAFMGLRELLHDVSHRDVAGMTKYTAFTIEHGFKYLLEKMKAVPEGNSNLLGNSAVVWTNEFGDGNAHTMAQLPIIAAGGAQGKWKTGRYIRFGRKRRHVDFLVSLCRTFGMNVTKFGQDPSAGPISELGV